MTAVEYRIKYPKMSDRDIARLMEIDQKMRSQVAPTLSRVEDVTCESCQ